MRKGRESKGQYEERKWKFLLRFFSIFGKRRRAETAVEAKVTESVKTKNRAPATNVAKNAAATIVTNERPRQSLSKGRATKLGRCGS